MKKILVIGAVGQIGSELTMALRNEFGNDNVIASTRKTPPSDTVKNSGPFEFFDIVDRPRLTEVCKKYNVDAIVNMAAILSAVGEQNPMMAWDVGMNDRSTCRSCPRNEHVAIAHPGSIAAFGPGTRSIAHRRAV